MNGRLYSALAGFYFLAADGQLGYYGHDGQFEPHAKLNAAFAEYNRRFLHAYRESEDIRLPSFVWARYISR